MWLVGPGVHWKQEAVVVGVHVCGLRVALSVLLSACLFIYLSQTAIVERHRNKVTSGGHYV